MVWTMNEVSLPLIETAVEPADRGPGIRRTWCAIDQCQTSSAAASAPVGAAWNHPRGRDAPTRCSHQRTDSGRWARMHQERSVLPITAAQPGPTGIHGCRGAHLKMPSHDPIHVRASRPMTSAGLPCCAGKTGNRFYGILATEPGPGSLLRYDFCLYRSQMFWSCLTRTSTHPVLDPAIARMSTLAARWSTTIPSHSV